MPKPATIRDAAEQLAQAGAEIEELSIPDSIETAYADWLLIMSVEAAAFHEPVYRRQAEDCQPKLRAMRPTGWRWTASLIFPRPGKPAAVHRRYGATGAAVRHPADAGHARAGTRRSHEHWPPWPFSGRGRRAYCRSLPSPPGIAESGLPLGV